MRFVANTRLRLIVQSGSTTDATVRCSGLVLGDDGELRPFNVQQETGTAGSWDVKTNFIQLPPGILIGALIAIANTEPFPPVGSVWCRAEVLYGTGDGAITVMVLGTGYVSGYQPIQCGDILQQRVGTTDRLPLIEVLGTPAPGAGYSGAITDVTLFPINLVGFRLVTDANAANRTVTVSFTSGTTVLATAGSTTAQAASLTCDYAFSLGGNIQQVPTAGWFALPLPNFAAPSNTVMAITVTNIQAGDQLSMIHVIGTHTLVTL